jgi:hypothetical protein
MALRVHVSRTVEEEVTRKYLCDIVVVVSLWWEVVEKFHDHAGMMHN